MENKVIADIFKACEPIEWQWDIDAWKHIMRVLSLEETRRVDSGRFARTDYLGQFPVKTSARWLDGRVIALIFCVAFEPESVPNDDADQVQQSIDTVNNQFIRYIDEARSVLGPAVFLGHPGDTSFPKDQSADYVALWRTKSARFMLQIASGGPFGPSVIQIVIAPLRPDGNNEMG